MLAVDEQNAWQDTVSKKCIAANDASYVFTISGGLAGV